MLVFSFLVLLLPHTLFMTEMKCHKEKRRKMNYPDGHTEDSQIR